MKRVHQKVIDKRVSENFSDSESAQYVRNLSNSDIDRIRDSETRSLVYDLHASLNKSSENFVSYNDSLSKEKTISQQANLTESQRLPAAESLEHEYAQYVTNKMELDKAISILTDSGSPETRAQRAQLKDEFTNELAQNIRKGHFNNESKVSINYAGMSVPKDSMKYSALSYQENVNKFEESAKKGGILQEVTFVYFESNIRSKMSPLDSINYGRNVYEQSRLTQKEAYTNQIVRENNFSNVDYKIAENKRLIDSKKSENKRVYDDKF